jgi:hypothetical protein
MPKPPDRQAARRGISSVVFVPFASATENHFPALCVVTLSAAFYRKKFYFVAKFFNKTLAWNMNLSTLISIEPFQAGGLPVRSRANCPPLISVPFLCRGKHHAEKSFWDWFS